MMNAMFKHVETRFQVPSEVAVMTFVSHVTADAIERATTKTERSRDG
jgi:hypothetical protein